MTLQISVDCLDRLKPRGRRDQVADQGRGASSDQVRFAQHDCPFFNSPYHADTAAQVPAIEIAKNSKRKEDLNQ